MTERKYKIEIFNKNNIIDSFGGNLKKDVVDFGIRKIEAIKQSFLYLISGDITVSQIKYISRKLLCDPITQNYKIIKISRRKSAKDKPGSKQQFNIEIWLKPNVTDTVGETTKIGILDLGIKDVSSVRTGVKYGIVGITKKEVIRITEKLLSNKVIHQYEISR